MKRKEVLSLLFLFLLVNSFFLVAGQTPADLNNFQDEKIVQDVQNIQQTAAEANWEYLSQRWKEVFLKNKYISAIDSLFKKINIVFNVFLGENYNLSINLFFVFLLWVFFLLSFYSVLAVYTPFSKGIVWVMAIGINVIGAQFGIFRFISGLAIKAIFVGGTVWRWISFFIFFFALVFVWVLVAIVAKRERARKDLNREIKQKLNQDVLDETVKGILKGLKE